MIPSIGINELYIRKTINFSYILEHLNAGSNAHWQVINHTLAKHTEAYQYHPTNSHFQLDALRHYRMMPHPSISSISQKSALSPLLKNSSSPDIKARRTCALYTPSPRVNTRMNNHHQTFPTEREVRVREKNNCVLQFFGELLFFSFVCAYTKFAGQLANRLNPEQCLNLIARNGLAFAILYSRLLSCVYIYTRAHFKSKYAKKALCTKLCRECH